MSTAETQKRESHVLNGTPDKRLFWSIINDYDLKTALCELADNAVDLWFSKKPRGSLIISIGLDYERQLISYSDNAGGVAEADLRLLISPGGSNNNPDAASIGVFGVGSKRAAVALAETIQIKTRHESGKTFQIDIDKDWLANSSWHIPSYETGAINPGETRIALSGLRRPLTEDDVAQVRHHLADIYGWFLEIDDFVLKVNDQKVEPANFEQWAYPKDFEPRELSLNVTIPDAPQPVVANITAGLIYNRLPDEDNYGVYFYCNNRLIAKELKSREVGYYVSAEAGVPHPDASLCRVIIRIAGPAKAMPWNSSKTGIHFSHPIFLAIRARLIELVSYYSKLSRRLKYEWDEKVYPMKSGNIIEIDKSETTAAKRLHLPTLPTPQRAEIETIRGLNAAVIEEQPWTLGLVESVAAVDAISRLRLETKNRIALIVLDSTLEISFKEFLVQNTSLIPPGQTLESLFKKRSTVVDLIQSAVPPVKKLRDRIDHYYRMRCELIHKRITVEVTPTDITSYEDIVKSILQHLFGLAFK